MSIYVIHSSMFDRDPFRVLIDWFHLISFIDISTTLYRIVPLSKNELQAIDKSVTSIIIPNWTCNDIDYTIFDFSRFSIVESIEIGNDCFKSVQTFKIDGLNQLKTIKIGENSFTQVKSSVYYWDSSKVNNQSRSFHILDCESLESIQIGEYSFCDFGGGFELSNLKSLKSIQIGTIGSYSNNFNCSSFVIRGMDMILTNEWLDLPNLESITLGDYAFCVSISTIIESIECEWMKWSNRSSFTTIYSTRMVCTCGKKTGWIMFTNDAK